MSSIVGHTLIGAVTYLAGKRDDRAFSAIWTALLAFCAISPDLDYIPIWLYNYHHIPRITHSFTYCVLVSSIILASSYLFKKLRETRPAIWSIYAASCSHLLLDYLVGVHKNVYFWPFSRSLYSSPYGILPSAGQLSLLNPLLWRNLLIEMGILIPISLIVLGLLGKYELDNRLYVALGAIFIIFSVVGLNLQR